MRTNLNWMLTRHAPSTALAIVLFCTTISSDALAAPFQVGDFITYSQQGWGSLGSAAEPLLANHFEEAYPNGVEVGISGNLGFSALFTTVQESQIYLPASGSAGPLENDSLDPHSTSSGAFGGYLLAMTFNVDFNDAGFLAGSAATRLGDLSMVSFATLAVEGVLEDFSHLNGLSVRQFLAAANICLGGGVCSNTYEGMSVIARDLSSAFDGGVPTQFAQTHLQLPAGPVPTPVPEPATLSMLGMALAALTARHRRNRATTTVPLNRKPHNRKDKAMTMAQRLIGVLLCLIVGVAAPARADVVTDWNTIMLSTIGAAPPGAGPSRICEMAMVHIAMHDAVQAIQQRFETYSPDITPGNGSVIAAAAKAARDVLVNKFPAQTDALDATYRAYLTAHQLTASDPGVAAGAQAAAALIGMRVGDGTYPVPAPTFFGSTEIGKWRPTAFNAAGEPLPMAGSWLATSRPFAVMHSSQFFSGTPPLVTSRQYTNDYNEVKALGRNVGSTRTPDQTALAVFYSDAPPNYWNRTMRWLTDRYIKDVGDSARMFALVNIAMADAIMTSWQTKIQYNVWRPSTAIQLGESDGNRNTAGDPTWQPLFANPNYPDYSSGANSLGGAATEMLRLFFRDDSVNFPVIGVNGNRDYTRFSDVGNDVVEARILMGIHFRFADVAARSSGQRVARWVYKYFLRADDGDEFDFVQSLDTFEEIGVSENNGAGQDDTDAERPGHR